MGQKRKQVKSFNSQILAGPESDRHRHKQARVVKELPKGRPRNYTVSIAIPCSVIAAAPTLDLKTILAGQIGRICVISSIDEVIIYNDQAHQKDDATAFLARALQYMETPQYMRKTLIPVHPDLKAAGLLPLLETAHHPGLEDVTRFREGVTIGPYHKEGGTLVDIGCFQRANVEPSIQQGVRVTVELTTPLAAKDTRKGQAPLPAKVISPKVPREAGYYWGYSIRTAASLSEARNDSPYKEGYDLSIGVSDLSGQDVHGCLQGRTTPFKHLLIVFGASGGGLEEAIDSDENLRVSGEDAKLLFDILVNPSQNLGTKSLRLEVKQ
ncbi:DUF171-domain-containing protein [Hesseltinella vesiculosa]|uniref:DUF171-domain-containing protein n=1 Tax=Hesseltinella vesiculosa TaxID=101127 RepID=A0A1X2GUA0_9FUNG|nr:DUF171-domain-containing protein [Hesseltinella vesiculosa]